MRDVQRVSSATVCACLPASLSGFFLWLSRARNSTVPRRHTPTAPAATPWDAPTGDAASEAGHAMTVHGTGQAC